MILTELAAIDALLGRTGRDRLLDMGATHGEETRVALAAATNDPARLCAEAHRLRGAVAPFGAAALTALLLRVEQGESVPPTEVDAAIAAFVRACRDALGTDQ